MRLMQWQKNFNYDGADGGAGAVPGGAPGAPGGAPGASPPGSPPPGPWYQGKVDDPQILGHWQNLGWHQKSAEEIAVLATKSHREAQSYIGAPADKLIRLPAQEGDSAAWNQVFSKLGKPADAAGYDFSGVKHIDDKPVDPNLDAAVRQFALESNLTKGQASSVLRGIVKHLDAQRSTEVSAHADKIKEEKATLDKSWGLNKDVNMRVAQSGARTLGISEAEIKALENVVGYSRVMEMMRMVGAKMGEDQFVDGSGPGGAGVMTREQAIAKKAELMKDTAWREAYLKGDSEKGREMRNLIEIIGA